MGAKPAKLAFPDARPKGGSFPRPRKGETLDISPPGFCWWRAAKRGVRYRLRIMDGAGAVAYESPVLKDPVHVPTEVLPAGRYTWTVQALDGKGKVRDARESWSFMITRSATPQPWAAPKELLARVPAEHPRLLFPKASLDEVRATLKTTRREAFESLRRQAKRLLRLKPPPEPDYDEIEDRAVRRIAYMKSFSKMRKFHQGGMVPLALMYALTGERKYGDVAKAILLGATEWDPEGISSVMAPHGDEVGLGLGKSGAQAYDWLHDLLSDAEREKVRSMLVARADQMLRRLRKRDFLNRPETSHNGRLPGYLVEHAIALAEEPRARVWMDYAMRTFMTAFPHWAGKDGGWAEGIPYGLAYNTIYLMPFEALRRATGFDLWQRPFYRKVRRFFMYNISPCGEIMPWGDTEHADVPRRSSNVRSLLQFHALRYSDPVMRWWVNLLKTRDGKKASLSALPGVILPDTVEPKLPTDLPPDAAFFGVGWAVLHSDLTRPDQDLMVMFKSSPYGPVSHSHADQNSFAIMKGGNALARPGGERWPTHGSPFHTQYAQQTIAHNAILVNGQGQINRNANANGRLVRFETTPCFGYVCGDAKAAYGKLLKRCRRHVLLVRPGLVCIVDDLEAPEPAEFQWLMHAREELDLNEAGQTFVSHRKGAAMRVHLITPGGFSFAQTSEWPMSPKTGFPKVRKKEPQKQWHFTACTRERSAKRRIAAIMVVGGEGDIPDRTIKQLPNGKVEIRSERSGSGVVVRIDLSTAESGRSAILGVQCGSVDGGKEALSVR